MCFSLFYPRSLRARSLSFGRTKRFGITDEGGDDSIEVVRNQPLTLPKKWAEKNTIYKTAAAAILAAKNDTNSKNKYFGQVLENNKDEKGKRVF